MERGRRIAFDVGAVRTGVAVCDPDGIFSSPVGNVTSIEEALAEIAEYEPLTIYVGLPLNLRGEHTKSTEAAIYFARELSRQTVIPIRLIDERLTTKTASAMLRTAGKNARTSKAVVDAAAASLILEQAIAIEKAGSKAGVALEELE